jgi:triosephosphate isomerase
MILEVSRAVVDDRRWGMRKPLIAGNWKMNKTPAEARTLIREMRDPLDALTSVDRVLCPPFVDLPAAVSELEGTTIGLGAQNMYWEGSGAYTGEISPLMLQGLCQYVILGHSERRQFFGEDAALVNRKIKAAVQYDLLAILCIGEDLQERERGCTEEVLIGQLEGSLKGITTEDAGSLVIAYEPIWAIGTGKAATGSDVDEVISESVRATIGRLYDQTVGERIRVLYGGSVTPSNICEFMAEPNIDGALVGGASLRAPDFVAIVEAAARSLGD